MADTLIADIGGTNSRFAVSANAKDMGSPVELCNRDFASFEAVFAAYLDKLDRRPERALLAIAGPVKNDSVYMTNLGWSIQAPELADKFGLSQLHLMNDFEAVAWSTLQLPEDGLVQVGGGQPQARSVRGILGPGTGLGVGSLVPVGDDWIAVAGEGGHVSMAARTDLETELVQRAVAEFGHCSAERLISGPGLVWIYQALGGEACEPPAVTAAAAKGEALAMQALECMACFLGTVAADLALTLGASGGIYLGGGILPTMVDSFSQSGFRERFEAKGRFSNYLKQIPTFVITAPYASLRGLAVRAASL